MRERRVEGEMKEGMKEVMRMNERSDEEGIKEE